MGSHALLLNASFEPLHIVSWQRALQLLFQGKVEVVEEWDREVRTINFTMKVPSVLRLIHFVSLKRKKQIVRFSRTNVMLRDGFRCQYCGRRAPRGQLTLDHVVPVVQGGRKSWSNIVTSCRPCNQRKGGRTPEQAGMRLIRTPDEPTWLPKLSLQFGLAVSHEKWKLYLNFVEHPVHGDP